MIDGFMVIFIVCGITALSLFGSTITLVTLKPDYGDFLGCFTVFVSMIVGLIVGFYLADQWLRVGI